MRPRTVFTLEAFANLRHRYLETNEPLASIARDFDISARTLGAIAKRENWPMRSRKARELPLGIRLKMEAENAAEAGTQDAGENQSPDLADRLERAVERELAAVERRRATSLPDDPDRTARTLDRLTATLSKIRRLRARDTSDHVSVEEDDMPEDIDEFRCELARRIDAFVRSRTGEGA